MSSRFALTALAAASLCCALPAFAQGSGVDRDRHNPPESYPAPQAAPPAPQQPAAPARGAGRGEQQAPRDANRAPRQPRPDGQPQAQPRNDGPRGDNDRRYGDRRDHGQGGRNYGYVAPRPYYYGAPRVYYPVPRIYYGGYPQTYYPYASPAPVVFQPGDFLPPEFRSAQFVVLDWEWRGLSPPPYGYQWMLLGPDSYALVAMSTGQIVSLVAAR